MKNPIERWWRFVGPESPFGPGTGGVLFLLSWALLLAIAGPPVWWLLNRLLGWWWKWWAV